MGHLGVVLYESFGEEYPEVLGSILGAMKVIILFLLNEFNLNLLLKSLFYSINSLIPSAKEFS